MAARILPSRPIQAQAVPFDITVYPLWRQRLPLELVVALEEAVEGLPCRKQSRPRVDEGEFLLLLAEALWCAERFGCVTRTSRELAADMTRRLRTRTGDMTLRVSAPQVGSWIGKPRRLGKRKQAAVDVMRKILVLEKRQTMRRGRRGPKKLLLHGQDDRAAREFFGGE